MWIFIYPPCTERFRRKPTKTTQQIVHINKLEQLLGHQMKKITYEINGEQRQLQTKWFRGKHTNFLPFKKDLYQENGIDKFILDGWLPESPFIKKDSNIVTIGSCFAREIVKYVDDKGYSSLKNTEGTKGGVDIISEGVNNTFALRQLFEWAWLGSEPREETWHGEDKSVIHRDKKQQTKIVKRYSNADVFIITLGLSEVWYNKMTNDVFWRAVPYDKYNEKSHGFRVTTVDENKINLIAILKLIKQYAPSASVIFTLSPVPLMATFRPVSCITANSVSKAILRVAVDEVLREGYDNVYYWPSYEIAKEYSLTPYEEDNRHVTRETVNIIMEKFAQYYVDETADQEIEKS